MRERVTFVQPLGEGVDPKALDLQEAGLLGPQIEAVREDRFSLAVGLDELPAEVKELLRDVRKLDIRWASTRAYDSLEPFASRISPGFHLTYTPAIVGAAHEPYALPASPVFL